MPENRPLSEKELLAWTGYSRPADLERFLRNHNIAWLPGKGGQICTTMQSIQRIMDIQEKINGAKEN